MNDVNNTHETSEQQETNNSNNSKTQQAKRLLHVQVANNPTQENLQAIAESFVKALNTEGDSVLATNDGVQTFVIAVDPDQPFEYLNVQGAISIDVIAKVAHEVNQKYIESQGGTFVSWMDTTDQQRVSMIQGTLFKLHNPTITAEQQHNEWLRVKDSEGWTYGETKDEEKKTNPAFLPYDQLPQAQRVKDFLFQGVVESLRDKLPIPQLPGAVERFKPNEGFLQHNFQELAVGDLWRFTGQDQVYKALSNPFINYAPADAQGNVKKTSQWAINAAPVEESESEQGQDLQDTPEGESEANDEDFALSENPPDSSAPDNVWTDDEESQPEVQDDASTDDQSQETLDDVKVQDEEDEAKLKPWIAENGEIKQPAADNAESEMSQTPETPETPEPKDPNADVDSKAQEAASEVGKPAEPDSPESDGGGSAASVQPGDSVTGSSSPGLGAEAPAKPLTDQAIADKSKQKHNKKHGRH